MRQQEFSAFQRLVTDVSAFYQRDLSPFAMDVWWAALRRFELPDVQRAFSIHCQDPEHGQWMPKPADVIRVLDGTQTDRSAIAWSKVDKAVGMVGPYRDVVFDDALIHVVIQDMGGWIALCNCSGDEWPFRANEFQKRYQGYAMRGSLPEYQKSLTGIANAHNLVEGHETEPPVLIGDNHAAKLVYQAGADKAVLQVSPLRNVAQLAEKIVRTEGK